MTNDAEILPEKAALPAVAASTTQAVLWILLTSVTTSSVNAIAKSLATDLHAFQLVFFYSALALLGFLPMLVRGKISLPPPGTRLLYVARAVLEFIGFSLVFYCVSRLPLPQVTSLQFLAPLLGSLSAVLFLREQASLHSWLALLGGVVGVLIITRPDVGAVQKEMLLVILAAVCFATCSNLIKLLSRRQSAMNIAFYMLLFTGVLGGVAAVPVWQPVPDSMWGMLGLMGLLVFTAQCAVAQAMSRADLVFVLPFFFLNMVWSSLYGYLFFNEIVTVPSIVGSVVILASTMYALLMARRRRRMLLTLEP